MSKTQIVLDKNPNDTNTENDSYTPSLNMIPKTITLDLNRNEVMDNQIQHEYADRLMSFFGELTDQFNTLIEEWTQALQECDLNDYHAVDDKQERLMEQFFEDYRIG